MRIRAYTPEDKEACLAIFDSNMPTYFADHERSEFVTFLDEDADQYFVVEHDAGIIACGGFFVIPNTPVAVLTWGMVAREQHSRGIGRLLLLTRLQRLCEEPSVTVVKLQTSQHTYGFFEKVGFKTEKITENGFGAGLHRYDISLVLEPARCQSIREQLAAHALPD
jgi:ribosomal protein S18 acetylase RimI-like enzyme